jgi:hypothetical protein
MHCINSTRGNFHSQSNINTHKNTLQSPSPVEEDLLGPKSMYPNPMSDPVDQPMTPVNAFERRPSLNHNSLQFSAACGQKNGRPSSRWCRQNRWCRRWRREKSRWECL